MAEVTVEFVARSFFGVAQADVSYKDVLRRAQELDPGAHFDRSYWSLADQFFLRMTEEAMIALKLEYADLYEINRK